MTDPMTDPMTGDKSDSIVDHMADPMTDLMTDPGTLVVVFFLSGFLSSIGVFFGINPDSEVKADEEQ